MLRNTLGSYALCVAVSAGLAGVAGADALQDGFANPPASARPRTWWHWMNGNVTAEGIAKDLDWMQRAGLGGVQNFDANLRTPQVVAQRLVYMTPEWQAAFRGAVTQAQSKGLEFAIASSPGWSETGGPWVQPADGMKKLVWSETLVSGGRRFTGTLAAPPRRTGPFQTLSSNDPLQQIEGATPRPLPEFYADVAVLAVPDHAARRSEALPRAQSADGKMLDATALLDGDPATGVAVAKGSAQSPGGLTLSYSKTKTIRSVTLFISGATVPFGDPPYSPILEARVGESWLKVAELPLAAVPVTASFAPVTAQEFRLVIAPFHGPSRPGLGAPAPGAAMTGVFDLGPPSSTVTLSELRVSEDAQVHRFEAKAGFEVALDYYALEPTDDATAMGIAPSTVIDLTSRLHADGSLDWTPPPGRWRVLRFGYSLTGKSNHPATPEATGLEVDKYDGAAVRRYLDTYLDKYRGAVGADLMGRQGIRALLNDSIEAGPSNWTPRLIDEFRALRGYDPRPWLPTLTGILIGSRRQSDAFLYDFRRTLSDLIAREHYGTIAAVAHERGLISYGEALEDQRPVLGDDMEMRSHTDIPMAALWYFPRDGAPRSTLLGDMKGASSVAHVYGRNLAAAESMTSAFWPWALAPADLKHVIDLEFASGINRPVIHTSVHQPLDDKVPGLSLAIFGQYFNRHETWAEMARPWIDYIARNSFLLQQGRNVADVAYFYGEEQPLTAQYAYAPLTDTPIHYGYDFVNAGVLRNEINVEDGTLATRGGARYRVLYLGAGARRVTLPLLQRIAWLVERGATVVGAAPQDSPSLNDDSVAFEALVQRLWSGAKITAVGKGRVIADADVEAGLAAMGVTPDFAPRSAADGEILFVHRLLEDGDLYFVNHRNHQPQHLEVRFRESGRQPELWHADSGLAEPLSYWIEDGVTVVSMDLAADDSCFVVFRKPADDALHRVAPTHPQSAAVLDGPWTVAFQSGRGAPAATTLDMLMSLSDSLEPGIRYFSGIATYSRHFALPSGIAPGAPLRLDLGQVGDVAEVRLNGRLVGTPWHAPYVVDVSAAVRRGDNALEVKVADLWVNRLIGDVQPGAQRITFTAAPTYTPDAPLRPAGLIGPVTLLTVKDGIAAR